MQLICCASMLLGATLYQDIVFSMYRVSKKQQYYMRKVLICTFQKTSDNSPFFLDALYAVLVCYLVGTKNYRTLYAACMLCQNATMCYLVPGHCVQHVCCASMLL